GGATRMWLVSLRDLQFRSRRFVVAVVVTSLVFGIALAIDGMRRSVQREGPAIVALFAADQWLVARGATGPFTTTRVLDSATAKSVRGAPGVKRADAVVLSRTAIGTDPPTDANLVGHELGGLGSPPISVGRAAKRPGEVVVSPGVSVSVGERLSVGGTSFRVVGQTSEGRFYFGVPSVFMSLHDAQEIVFKGQPLAMGIAIEGTTRPPAGTTALTNAQVVSDLNRPLSGGTQSIVVMAVLMWIIAAGIIGLIVYLSAIERIRDFAVFKATGAPTRIIVGGLMLQAVMVALAAAILAIGVSRIVRLGLPFPAALSASGVLQLVAISIVVGVVASLAGVRRALSTDPAVAFGGK
ncbi:MAG: FtsX-like permease family protein, partial [Acidimicrobiia bacterium]